VVDMDKVSLNGMAITGWKPMGISRTVTKSKGTLLYTIDNKPAIEMYFKYLGQTEKLDDKDFNMFKEISIHYPLIVKRETGETVLRSPMSIDHVENALVMDSEMQEGTEFWFTVPPDFDIAEEIIAQAEQIKSENMGDADALLIFSCAGRPPVLGPLVTVENNGLADVWQTPMAGFFTYGEYGRAKNGRQEFHSGACCWVALKEK
ncbi:MAG TPA: FIST C-terminal domain-containing protein, partial [Ferruginibacter sp.]|nr:FIST C-terminal domain-containing protein [Ferruginibacter sp.]